MTESPKASSTPQPENAPKPKDNWDKLDILGKAVFAIAIPTVLAVWSYKSEAQKQVEAEESRKAEIVVQALSSRDNQRTEIKKDMFQELINSFFQNEQDIDKQILILELLAFNFTNRQFRLEPLFAYLEKKVDQSDYDDDIKKHYSEEIIRVINDSKIEEINNIIGSGGNSCDIQLKLNQTINLNKEPTCSEIGLPLTIKLLDIKDKLILVEHEDLKNNKKFQFRVNYFDTPFSDNTQLTLRRGVYKIFSIVVLQSLDPDSKSANVKLVVFPDHFYSSETSTINLDQLIGDKFINPIQSK
jgi:hypothetical protein